MEKISVIIPVFNTAKYLRRCVDSVLAQRFRETEIILVDDGSTDESGAICDALAAGYPDRISAIHQKNRGLSGARNAGIDAAKGDLIAFVDSDDYIDREMYAALAALMAEKDADAALGEMLFKTEDGKGRCRVAEGCTFVWNTEEALIQLNSYRYIHKSFCTGLYRRRLFDHLRFTEGILCEDFDLIYRLFSECGRVAYTSRPFYHYVQRSDSISRNGRINLQPLKIAEEQAAFFAKRHPEILFAAESACAVERMDVYTRCIRNGADCPKDLLRQLRHTARRYLKVILRNRHISRAKAAQVILFCFAPGIYRQIILKADHRRKRPC